jgi:hypothetical protein
MKTGPNKTGLIAPKGSILGARLHAKLVERVGPGVPWFDATLPEGSRASLGEAGVHWDGHDLNGFDTLFIHGFRYEDPVIPAADPVVDWSLWQAEHVRRQQRYSFLYSLLSRLEAGPATLFNTPSAHLDAFSRHHQLELLEKAGVPVARTLCTNDAEVARDFHHAVTEAGGLAVWRTVTGRSAWQIFRDRQRSHLMGADKPPVLIAPIVPGPVRRAFAVSGTTVLTLESAPPTDEGLERLELFQPLAGPLPTTEAAIAGAALTAAGLGWGSVLYVAGPDGPVVFDIDADPVITDLPRALSEYLLDHLAARLTGQGAPVTAASDVHARESLFLRRMLRIQFDMEKTKSDP